MYENKYIYDSLYGVIYLPEYVWKVIFTPEVQRLRELRLCNINSLCMETNIPNLFITGDSSGLAQGILQAAISGIAAAYGIIEKK